MSLLLFVKTIILNKTNVIFFESSPDLSSNTYPVFLEFLKRGYNNRYFLLWKIRKEKKYPKIKNTYYWVEGKKYSFLKKAFFHILFKHVAVNVCCNGFLLPKNNKQLSFYLTHGTFIKNVESYYNIPKEINYVLVASNESGKIISKTAKYPFPERVIATGFPYNDDLTNAKIDPSIFFTKKYKKYLIWYPTYKQHKSSTTASTSAKPISIIDDIKNAVAINEKLIKEDILLIIKPHFAQDLTKIINYNLSNIIFITDDFFYKNKITSYAFLSGCDALLTDYSAVYFDYLICNKPIAAIWEDIKEYEEFPGFCVNIYDVMRGAKKVYNCEDFISFIDEVSKGEDKLIDNRRELCDIYNLSTDGKNSKRVVDFIINKSGLKL